jgi:Na+-driven multidrug efflux pump
LAVVVAASQLVGAVLYVLDRVLIGAGDLRYLALTQLAAVVAFLPLAWVVLAIQAGVWRCGGRWLDGWSPGRPWPSVER